MIIETVRLGSIRRYVDRNFSPRGRSNLANFIIGAHRMLKRSERYGQDPISADFEAQQD
jgi:hypothetical protein